VRVLAGLSRPTVAPALTSPGSFEPLGRGKLVVETANIVGQLQRAFEQVTRERVPELDEVVAVAAKPLVGKVFDVPLSVLTGTS